IPAPHNAKGKSMDISESMLQAPVQKLMELIFNEKIMDKTLEALNYNRDVLPLDELTHEILEKGLEALKSVEKVFKYPKSKRSDRLAHLSDSYFTYIPHNFGRNAPPVINNRDMLDKEFQLVDSLKKMKIADEMARESKAAHGGLHALDHKFKDLGLQELKPLDPNSQVYRNLEG